ncbi:MAG: sodium:proton exchanger [Deltaproteobacteria bacterium HGW-Deltaproteobacteria-6]|nr:MAG: sodium:proton exchanger [Deltaproteobacteria bacterium HGW-Deltaproteobacteria-6]
MNEIGVLVTLAGGFAVALVFGYLANRLKLSPIIGYLLAGIVIGPFTPGFVADRASAEHFAEIGVILLLFGIGLRFNLRELVAVWRLALPGALIQSTISTGVLAVILHLMGWDWISGIILGMAISVASTVVMALVLAEWHDLHAKIGHIAIGWTVVEDILTVAMLLLLPIIFTPDRATQSVGVVLGLAGLKVAGLLVVVVLLGKWVIPWTLERIAKTRSRELFTLAVLVLAIGIAVGAAKIFGVSMALGAFLAGLAVGRSEFAARAANDALPMRDAFAVLFFVSIGMLFDPRSLVEVPLVIAAVMFVVIIIKPLAAMLTVRALGQPLSTAIPVGAAFSQVGEFSFILGTVALSLGLINDAGWNALVAASILSIGLNPYIYRFARKLSSGKIAKTLPVISGQRPAMNPNHCILIGYGPVGKIVHHLLKERDVEITVIDLNLDTVRSLNEMGTPALYGDVLRPGTLDEAGIATAGSLILSADIEDAAEIIRHARHLNPDLHVIARCAHLRDAQALSNAGANVVAAGEAEVGVALAEVVTAADERACSVAAEHRESIRRSLYEAPKVP